MKTDVIGLLEQLVSYPALSGEEAEIATFVQSWLGRAGLPAERFENNVYTWVGDGEHCLLLNSHLDVVPASSDHPFDPFTAVTRDGRMFGRGTVDAKASGAAMLTALSNLRRNGAVPDHGKVMVALTACEETANPTNGLQQLLPQLPPLSGAIVGEPTSLQPCFSQKGLLILEVTAHGKSAHAARPSRGRNAVVMAARDIARLEEMGFERVHPQLGEITKVVTVIQGGSARNVIPESCEFVVDIRTTPSYTHEEIVDQIREAFESHVHISSERYIPAETPEPSNMASAVRAALPSAEPFGSPTVSDWAFLGSVPAVKLGPGASKLSHTGAESIELSELKAAVSIYEAIAKRFFETTISTNHLEAYALEKG
jgi:acetylornithine deacetylase